MKKFCCLILMFMLCMSTTYAAKGKECIKYLSGEWAIPNTDDCLFYDSLGDIVPEEHDPKSLSGSVDYYAIRYKYKSIDESSYINDSSGKGKIIITSYYGHKVEYVFQNFKQMRWRDYPNGNWSNIYTKFYDDLRFLKGYKIIDYDTIAEPPMSLHEGNILFYTSEKNAEQLKIIVSRKNFKESIDIYNKIGKSVYHYTFAADSGLYMRKIFLRPGKSDLIFYSLGGTGQYIQDFLIIGAGKNGIETVYNLGDKGHDVGSGARVLVERDGITLQGLNGYNGANGSGLKYKPPVRIVPIKVGNSYTYQKK